MLILFADGIVRFFLLICLLKVPGLLGCIMDCGCFGNQLQPVFQNIIQLIHIQRFRDMSIHACIFGQLYIFCKSIGSHGNNRQFSLFTRKTPDCRCCLITIHNRHLYIHKKRKELNVKKEKTSILNPIQHIKLNQQLTTVTEEIEELKSRKEQLIFQAQCTTDKDMMNLSKKYDQMNKNLDVLDSQDTSLKKQLEKDATAFREEKFRPEPEQYTKLLDTRIQIRPDFRDKLIEQLKGTFGKYYDYHRRDIAANEVDYLNVEDPDVFSHRAWELEYQRKQEMRRNQPVRSKKRSYDMEL